MVTKVVMTGLCLSFMAARGLAQTLIFPHLVDGNIGDTTRWSTEIDLVNTTTVERAAKVSFFNPNGTAKTIVFPRSTGLGATSSFTLTLAPNAMKVVHIDSGFMTSVDLHMGWILVEGSGGVTGFVIFRRLQNSLSIAGIVLAEAAISPQPAAKIIQFIPRVAWLSQQNIRDPVEIAYALANPDPSSAATGEIQVFRESTFTASFTLPPRGQMAEFVSQRFGTTPLTGEYVRIVMKTGAVSAIGVRMVGELITPLQPQTDSSAAGLTWPQEPAALFRPQRRSWTPWVTPIARN